MKYSKILIPTIKEYNGCQFRSDTIEDFKKFIIDHAYNISIEYHQMKNQEIPMSISFTWNPSMCDYPDKFTVCLNQWFIYDTEDYNIVNIVDAEDIKEDWYIHEIGN